MDALNSVLLHTPSDSNFVSKIILCLRFLLPMYMKLGFQEACFRIDVTTYTRIDIESCLLNIPVKAILPSVATVAVPCQGHS
jgi:hypothetical protein